MLLDWLPESPDIYDRKKNNRFFHFSRPPPLLCLSVVLFLTLQMKTKNK